LVPSLGCRACCLRSGLSSFSEAWKGQVGSELISIGVKRFNEALQMKEIGRGGWDRIVI
jgi:hypothetical protein